VYEFKIIIQIFGEYLGFIFFGVTYHYCEGWTELAAKFENLREEKEIYIYIY
jgi:hypothetical protein